MDINEEEYNQKVAEIINNLQESFAKSNEIEKELLQEIGEIEYEKM